MSEKASGGNVPGLLRCRKLHKVFPTVPSPSFPTLPDVLIMARTALPLALGLLAVAGDAAALKFPITGRPSKRSLGRRAPTTNDYGSSALNNTNDFQYYTDIVLNGTTFDALIDTGRCVSPACSVPRSALFSPGAC